MEEVWRVPLIYDFVAAQGWAGCVDKNNLLWIFTQQLFGDLEIFHTDRIFFVGESIVTEDLLDLYESFFRGLRRTDCATRFDRWPVFDKTIGQAPETRIGLHGIRLYERGALLCVAFYFPGLVSCVCFLGFGAADVCEVNDNGYRNERCNKYPTKFHGVVVTVSYLQKAEICIDREGVLKAIQIRQNSLHFTAARRHAKPICQNRGKLIDRGCGDPTTSRAGGYVV